MAGPHRVEVGLGPRPHQLLHERNESSDRPDFEKEIVCPECGELSKDEVFLTEVGQGQLTRATDGLYADDLFDSEVDELNGFGLYDGECRGCDFFTRVNYVGLCEECAGKYERDLIRQRELDYSAFALGIPAEKREALRKEIIGGYGERLELLAPAPKKDAQRKRKKNRKSKRKKSGRSR